MGVAITDILTIKEGSFDELAGKVLAVDASLFLYQFLATIRQRDGTPLMDSKRRITSHLSGVFSRTTQLMQKGIKLVHVFDGKPPELKRAEQTRRSEAKKEAQAKYKIAADQEDVDSMRKFASRTSRLTPEMVEETKQLLSALGLPYVQAPGEGEAQASYMVKKGDAFGVASQDADCLMFQAPILIRNVSMIGKRKVASKLAYHSYSPEIISLSENLNNLGLSHDQFLALCILVGTDYNSAGVKGIGPKKALKALKSEKDLDKVFEDIGWSKQYDFSWKKIMDVIKGMETSDDYELNWGDPDEDRIKKLLVDEHDFSINRIEAGLKRLKDSNTNKNQRGLSDFF